MKLLKLKELILEEIKSTIYYKLHPEYSKELFYSYLKKNNTPYIKYNPNSLVPEKGNKTVGGFDPSQSINFKDALFVYDKTNHTSKIASLSGTHARTVEIGDSTDSHDVPAIATSN